MKKFNNKGAIFSILLIPVIFLILLIGSILINSSNESYETISYQGNTYELVSNTIGVDFEGYEDYYTGLEQLGKKIDVYKSSDVYEIKGIDPNDFLLFDNSAMLPMGPLGLYKNAAIKMDTVADFKPDSIDIYYYGEDIEAADLPYRIKDQIIIDKIISLVDKEPTAQVEVTWDDTYYNMDFKGTTYPNLAYRYTYIEKPEGTYYLQNEKLCYEIDTYLHDLIMRMTSENE